MESGLARAAAMTLARSSSVVAALAFLWFSSPVPGEDAALPPLLGAARNGDLALVEKLLEQGANPNEADSQGGTALQEAAFRGDLPVVKTLIEKGAAINLADRSGFTPLQAAAFDGRMEVAKFLISRGAQVQSSDRSGLTVLHYAASGGHVGMLKLLMASGANPSARSYSGATPLTMAEKGHRKEVIAVLRPLSGTVAKDGSSRGPGKPAVVIDDNNLPRFSPAEPAAPGSPADAGKDGDGRGWTDQTTSKGWPSSAKDEKVLAALRAERNRLLDSLPGLKKQCEQYKQLNDTLNNNRPLTEDQAALASRYEPSVDSPVRSWDGTFNEGAFEASSRASREAAARLRSDSTYACAHVNQVEDHIRRIEAEIAGTH